MRRTKGFTLTEMLLTLAIIGMLLGISAPVYASFLQRNDLDLTAMQLVGTLRRAETYARAGKGSAAWSIKIQSGTVTLFRGTDFAGRNTTYDETSAIPTAIVTSGLSEIHFSQLYGTPDTTGNIVLTSNTNETRTITLNAVGMVAY